ncbi:MAG TPA: hypothetical protein VFX49_18635 [Chloroflexota bacterium]|nr:hypothetical protein [Chloroflexota bacterium]
MAGAAAGLTLNGRTLMDWEPAAMELFLVIGPVLGLWPVAALALVAHRTAAVRRWTPAGLAVWLVVALTTMVWFGLAPLLR